MNVIIRSTQLKAWTYYNGAVAYGPRSPMVSPVVNATFYFGVTTANPAAPVRIQNLIYTPSAPKSMGGMLPWAGGCTLCDVGLY